MKLLITGGAGYIGAQVVRSLMQRGDEVVVLDNLSRGHRAAVSGARLVVADVGDRQVVRTLLADEKPDAVMHFAAFIEVGESVREPLKFYRNNVFHAGVLLEEMAAAGVDRFIFSSTAAVYGMPDQSPIMETQPLHPINPYGWTKRMVEQMLADLSVSVGLRYVALRYFNAAGADPDGEIGESHQPESHLIPLVLKTAAGHRPAIEIFGTDYPTPDGTCVRDYVHVSDLADAHLLALGHLMDGGASEIFNCGYGTGYSVKNVVDMVRQVTGRDFQVLESDRRAGDPAELVADSGKLVRKLGWKPRFNDLGVIVETAWNWEQNRRY